MFLFLTGISSRLFRKEPSIQIPRWAKIGVRKEKTFSKGKRLSFPENDKRRETIMSSKNNNQINIPEAREAMDRFKMQAAQDEDVSTTS